MLPSVDALQEFKVQTGIYPGRVRARGRTGQRLHQGGHQRRTTAPCSSSCATTSWTRRPYFFKDPESPTQTAPAKHAYRQNQYGFTLGGPVRIPKLFNGKNRLFFMSNYEGFKSRRPRRSSFGTTMTPAMRNGDFSVVPTPLQDPLTRVRTTNANGTTTVTSTPFPGNQIPANRFNQSSLLSAEQVRAAAEPARRPACRIATISTCQDAGGQGPVHRAHRLQRKREIAVVRPLQLDRRVDRSPRASS